jgi:hypothetical protein
MPEVNLKLGLEDDRVVSINVTDKNGVTYLVTLEIGSQNDMDDEIQVNVYKRKRNDKGVRRPNAIVLMGEPMGEKFVSSEKRYEPNGVWFEFHALEKHELKAVTDL